MNGDFRSKCRMHGCGTNPTTGRTGGGQPNNANALTNGEFTREAIVERKKNQDEIVEFNALLNAILSESAAGLWFR